MQLKIRLKDETLIFSGFKRFLNKSIKTNVVYLSYVRCENHRLGFFLPAYSSSSKAICRTVEIDKKAISLSLFFVNIIYIIFRKLLVNNILYNIFKNSGFQLCSIILRRQSHKELRSSSNRKESSFISSLLYITSLRPSEFLSTFLSTFPMPRDNCNWLISSRSTPFSNLYLYSRN